MSEDHNKPGHVTSYNLGNRIGCFSNKWCLLQAFEECTSEWGEPDNTERQHIADYLRPGSQSRREYDFDISLFVYSLFAYNYYNYYYL